MSGAPFLPDFEFPGHGGRQVMTMPYFPDELVTSDDVVVSENT